MQMFDFLIPNMTHDDASEGGSDFNFFVWRNVSTPPKQKWAFELLEIAYERLKVASEFSPNGMARVLGFEMCRK